MRIPVRRVAILTVYGLVLAILRVATPWLAVLMIAVVLSKSV